MYKQTKQEYVDVNMLGSHTHSVPNGCRSVETVYEDNDVDNKKED